MSDQKANDKAILRAIREKDKEAAAKYAAKQKAKGLIRKTYWLTPVQQKAVEEYLRSEKRKAAVEAARRLIAEEEAKLAAKK